MINTYFGMLYYTLYSYNKVSSITETKKIKERKIHLYYCTIFIKINPHLKWVRSIQTRVVQWSAVQCKWLTVLLLLFGCPQNFLLVYKPFPALNIRPTARSNSQIYTFSIYYIKQILKSCHNSSDYYDCYSHATYVL